MPNFIQDMEEYNLIKQIIKEEITLEEYDRHAKYRLKKKAECFLLIDDELFLRCEGNHKKVFVASAIQVAKIALLNLHNQNHYGQNRLYDLCKELYFGIPRSVVREVCSECVVCSLAQPLKTKEKHKNITAARPFERLIIDLIDMRCYADSNCNMSWILTGIDVYSKFAFTFPLKTKTAKEVTDNLMKMFFLFGYPAILQSDNGKEFTNSILNQFCHDNKILFIHGRPRHPQSQGQVERFNQTLTRYLQKHISDSTDPECKNWLQYLELVTFNYNNAVHTATQKQPFKVMFNRHAINNHIYVENPIDLETNTIEASESEDYPTLVKSNYYDRMSRKCVHNSIYEYNVGDTVVFALDYDNNLKTKKLKLNSFYSEPHTITAILSNNYLELKNNANSSTIKVHASKVKKINV